MKQRFLDKDWWKNTTGATAGTIIGIILTFGTTFYIENRNGQKDRHDYLAQLRFRHRHYGNALAGVTEKGQPVHAGMFPHAR